MKRVLVALILAFIAVPAIAADYPAPKRGMGRQGLQVHTGGSCPSCGGLHTVGILGQPVLVLHGTTGSATSMLSRLAGELSAPASRSSHQVLIIIPTRSATGNPRSPPMA